MSELVPKPGSYSLPAWPLRCGFRYDAQRREYRKGDFRLRMIGVRAWKLFCGESDHTGRLFTTLRRSARAIEDSLEMKLREMTEGAPAQ